MMSCEAEDSRWYDRGRAYATAMLEQGTPPREILMQIRQALAAVGGCSVDEAVSQFISPDLAFERVAAKREFIAGIAAVAVEAGALSESSRGKA